MIAGRGILASLLLILAAAVMGGIMAFELGQRMPDGDAMVPATATRLPAPAAPALMPAGDADVASHRAVEALARPLFSPGRRPAPQTVAVPLAAAASVPRMTSVIVTPVGRRAVFLSGAGKPVVVTEGERIGGYPVKLIEAGRVTLSGPNGTRVVSTVFDSKSPTGTAGPATGLPGLQGLVGLPGLDSPPPTPAIPGTTGFLR